MRSEALLAEAFVEAHPDEAALVLERLAADDAAAVLGGLAPATAAGVLRRMAPRSAAEGLARLGPDRAGDVVAALPRDAAALVLRRTEPPGRAALLAALPPAAAGALEGLLRYPEDSAAALADPHVLALPDDLTAGEALARVRRAPRHALYYVYVVDREQRLVGVVNLRELMLAPPKAALASVMHSEVARLPAQARRAAIVEHPAGRTFHALPVVDEAGVFLGALRYETIRKLEDDAADGGQPVDALSTVVTFGELCWVGITGVFVDLAATVAPPLAPDGRRGKDDHGDDG